MDEKSSKLKRLSLRNRWTKYRELFPRYDLLVFLLIQKKRMVKEITKCVII